MGIVHYFFKNIVEFVCITHMEAGARDIDKIMLTNPFHDNIYQIYHNNYDINLLEKNNE